MILDKLLEQIDVELARLQVVRGLLVAKDPVIKNGSRPMIRKKQKRNFSAATKKRMGAQMRRRWQQAKKAGKTNLSK